jgi:integrase
MGVTVRQKIKGRGKPWWVFIAHSGKPKSIKLGSKDAANELKKEIETELARGKLNLDTDEQAKQTEIPIFKEYSEKWVNGYVQATLSDSTHEKYQQVLKSHVWPTLANTPLDEINRGDVKNLLISKMTAKNGLSRSSISVIKNLISGVFESAIDEELIDAKNPTAGSTKKMKLGGKKKKIDASDALTGEEVSLILDSCKSHFPEYYPFFLIAASVASLKYIDKVF